MSEEKTLEEIEAETAAMQAKLAKLRGKAAPKVVSRKAPRRERALTRPLVEGEVLQDIQLHRAVGKSMHQGLRGPTLIQQIEAQMDKRRKVMEKMVIEHGMEKCQLSSKYLLNKGRYEGFAGALAILRSTAVQLEVDRSNHRLEIGDDT